MYNEARMIGVAVGIAVGLLIVAFVLRFINRNKAMATEYDEMQKQIRGVGYRYAFFTVMIFEALLCILTLGMELPAEPYVIHFAAIFIGVTVQAAYCIWNDAYVGLNTNLGRYIVIMTIVSLFNLKNARTTRLAFLEAARSASSSCPCLCPLRGHDHKSEKSLR